MRHTEKEQAVINGLDNVSNLTVSDDTKLIDIIVSSLYSEPVGSLVRELISNAVDSHKEAGKESLPFNVTLPTKFNPSFIVQDFGVGMSPETVDKIYNVIGASTKENSNEALGRWGLGSKTPLAYTSQFVIESVYDGTKTTYSIFKNESGIGTAVLERIDTIETNGVKVIVPVKPDDFNLIETELHSQLMFLHKPFNLNGERYEYEMEQAQDSFKQLTDKIYMRTSTDSYTNQLFIVQGGVSYIVDKNKVSQYLEHAGREDLVNLLNAMFKYTYRVVMFFDIGEINVPPSRESIIFDDSTVQNIINHLDEYYTKIESKIDDVFNSDLHVQEKVQKFIDDPVLHHYLKALDKTNLDWGFNAGSLTFNTKSVVSTETEFLRTDASLYECHASKIKKISSVRVIDYRMLLADTTKVLIRDTNYRPFIRMQELNKQGYDAFIVLTCSDDDQLMAESKKFIEERMLGVDYELMSNIELPKVDRKGGTTSTPTKCRTTTLQYAGHTFCYDEPETVLPEDAEGVAVCCSYYEAEEHDEQTKEDWLTFKQMQNFFATIDDCGVDMTTKLYAMNATNYKRFIKGDNIITLNQFIEKHRDVYEKAIGKYQRMANTVSRYKSFRNYLATECDQLLDMMDAVFFISVTSLPKSDFRSLVTRFETLRKNANDVEDDLSWEETHVLYDFVTMDHSLVTDKEKNHLEKFKQTLLYNAIEEDIFNFRFVGNKESLKSVIKTLLKAEA